MSSFIEGSSFLPAPTQAADGVGALSPVIVFRPSGVAAGNVYTTWSTAHAAALALEGPVDLVIDSSLAAANVSAGAWSLDQIRLCGVFDAASVSQLNVATGQTFTSCKQIGPWLKVVSTSSAAVISFSTTLGTFLLGEGSTLTGAGLLDFTAGDVTMRLDPYSTLKGSAACVISSHNDGCTIKVGQGAVIENDSLDTTGSGNFTLTWADPSASIGATQTGATVYFANIPIPRFIDTATASPIALGAGSAYRIDTTGGSIAYTLEPALAVSSPAIVGAPLIASIVTGTNAATIAPDGSDTIDGVAASITLTATGRRSVVLVSDGVSNWTTIATTDEGSVVTAVKTADYNASLRDFVRCDPSGGPFKVTLPALSADSIGKIINVKNTTSSATTISIYTTGGDTIDTAATAAISAGFGSLSIMAVTATEWEIY